MTNSIGTPVPDCDDRKDESRERRQAAITAADGRGNGATTPSGEETSYGATFALSFHKGLPHNGNGFVHPDSYHDMVRMLSGQEASALETLPIGDNRSIPAGAGTPVNPPRYAETNAPAAEPLGYRKLTSPMTGHVYEVQGADAGAFAIPPAPTLSSPELAAEMAEIYAMALLRDVSFSDIEASSSTSIAVPLAALKGMAWFNGSFAPTTRAEQRRFAGRRPLIAAGDLFRGSTIGAQVGPWLSQYLLIGNTTAAGQRRFIDNGGNPAAPNPSSPNFRNTRSMFGVEDGFVLFGTQIIDQRSIVAREGIDYLTNWAAWLDAQNGVDFNNFDTFRDRRRYLYTPRDIATYVHYDALYQAYLVACLLMLADGGRFPFGAGLPETRSRTRSAFASFGGPHILSLVTEVATRGLKAVWRQKWMHHRRARPEVVAALLTLYENNPAAVTAADKSLGDALGDLRALMPTPLLNAVAAHNTAQNANPVIKPIIPAPAGLPAIAPNSNYLLPMAFPEGSPTHPAYGAGHATVAGACVTILKAFFEMYQRDGTLKPWPVGTIYVSTFSGKEIEGGELVPWTGTVPAGTITVAGELDKLAANISIARNMAGVHYFTDYFESIRLGERIAVALLEEQLGMYGEPISMRFPSFDGDEIRIQGNGRSATVFAYDKAGNRIEPRDWYARYED